MDIFNGEASADAWLTLAPENGLIGPVQAVRVSAEAVGDAGVFKTEGEANYGIDIALNGPKDIDFTVGAGTQGITFGLGRKF